MIATTFIRPGIVQKVLVSANVRRLMLPQIVTDVVRGITDIRIANLVNASWMELEEDNVKIQADNVHANKISVGNFVINVLKAFITSRNANVSIYILIFYIHVNPRKLILKKCVIKLFAFDHLHSLRVQRNWV